MVLKPFILVIFACCISAASSSTIPCRTINDCSSILNPSEEYVCANYICMCANATTKNYENCDNRNVMALVRATGLKRNCTVSKDCEAIEGADCLPSDPNKRTSERICKCQTMTVESDNGKRCLRYATHPGDRCTENIQCSHRLESAVCEEGACRCSFKYHFDNSKSKCIRTLGFGQYCKPEEGECFQEGESHGANVMYCNTTLGHCMCTKHWKYNPNVGGCEYSSATRAVISAVLLIFLSLFSLRYF